MPDHIVQAIPFLALFSPSSALCIHYVRKPVRKSAERATAPLADSSHRLMECQSQAKGGHIMSDQSHSLKIRRWVLGFWGLVSALLLSSAISTSSVEPASAASPPAPAPSFTEFESGQVRPIAMSPDGTMLFAVNTPNDTVEIFDITSTGLAFVARVPVGVEPVAVAAPNNDEIWVVNHLSDSVSVVSLTGTPRVTRTLLVGDEPRDIVFAGSPTRAFITTAHRGQQRTHSSIADVPGAGDPQLTTPGVGRADVWVFDPANPGTSVGGRPLRIMTFFTDTPRALAVSPDKATVYVAGFKSGNQTTTVIEPMVCDGFNPNQPCTAENGATMPGGNPGPGTNFEGKRVPESGLIVKFNNSTQRWEDELGRNWNNAVRFRLPDLDVFSVNANTLTQRAAFAHVGTTLFNMATNPVSGKLYVSNTEAFNHVRFEGPGQFGGSTVQGHLAETRITVISGSTVSPRHLNKHIDYTKLAGEPGFDPTAKNHSLSTPLDIVVSRNGSKLYVAAFGSSKIGVFDTGPLENNTFNPRLASANYIPVSGGGPSGLALDEARGRLYVLTRFDDSVKVIDLNSKQEIAEVALPNPEPQSVVEGRPMLYDATRFSGNGEASCASCHIFGDMDDLAWDLGNPDDAVKRSPLTINFGDTQSIALGKLLFGVRTPLNGTDKVDDFHPMKGPMTTQTLRGLENSGAMHWRGDRANGFFGIDAVDASLSFNNFIVAFQGLVGSADLPTPEEMQKFTDFQLQVVPPPNPVRRLDNSLTSAQQRGRNFYFGSRPSDGINIPIIGGTTFNCNGCHVVDSTQGFFGTGRRASFEGITQIVKIPHLRNMYAKVGMFGVPRVNFFDAPDSGFTGDQVRGFGFVHDGSVDTVFRFLTAIVFRPQLFAGFPIFNTNGTRRDVEQFLLAFDSDLAPVVGQQVTLTSTNGAAAGPRITLLIQRAEASFTSKVLGGAVKECDLVVNVAQGGRIKNYLYDPAARNFIPDDGGARLSDSALRSLAGVPGQELTYTCVPTGSGSRRILGP
jgi:YVTN family beta-propeller protein